MMTTNQLTEMCNKLLVNSGYDSFGRFWAEFDGTNSKGQNVLILGFSDNRDIPHYVAQMDWIRGLLRKCGFTTRKRETADGGYWLKVTA